MLDADLQHPLDLIPQMYTMLVEKELDSVYAKRISRKGESKVRSFLSRTFYKLMNKMSDIELSSGSTDFRMMNRQTLDSILELQERNRFSKGIFSWVGYNSECIEYENVERIAGTSKWSFKSLFAYSIDAIVAFSTMPLTLMAIIGGVIFIIAVVMSIFVVIKTLFFGDPVAGFPTLICVISLIGGIQMLFIGVLGEYIARMYIEVKDRPIYLVQETHLSIKKTFEKNEEKNEK